MPNKLNSRPCKALGRTVKSLSEGKIHRRGMLISWPQRSYFVISASRMWRVASGKYFVIEVASRENLQVAKPDASTERPPEYQAGHPS